MRKFVRHPSSIPIEISVGRAQNEPEPRNIPELVNIPQFVNISHGGFACAVDEPIAVGSSIQLRIPRIWPDYRGCGVVVWCRETPPRFEVGIEFGQQDSFKAKMVEQLCQIEHYRKVAQDEGRELSSEQAADEWIALYACEFSELFGSSRS